MNNDAHNNDLASRIRALIGSESIRGCALKWDIPEGSLRQYLNGSVPGVDKVIAIARGAGVRIEWLATGEGPMRPDDAAPTEKSTPSALNLERLARIGEAIADLYREENARIYPRQLARLQGETYNDLAETTTSDQEWELGLKITLQRLRRDLRAQPGDGSSKRLA